MKRPLLSLLVMLALLVVVVVPSFTLTVWHASSPAAATLGIAGLYILLFAAFGGIYWKVPGLGTTVVRLLAGFAIVFVQGMVSYALHVQFDFNRFVQSLPVLLAMLFGALAFAMLARRTPACVANFAVKGVFGCLLITGVIGALHLSPFSSELEKPVVFYSEPSHFAWSFLPFLLYMAINASPRRRLILVLSGYLIALLIQNLTLVVGVTFIAVLTTKIRRSVFVALIIAALVTFASVNLDYFTARLDFFGESQNLSLLVYLSGWERALLDLGQTAGLGVGFQQFGIVGGRGEIMASIAALSGSDMNLLDGSAVAIKFVGEFGVIALGMLLAYVAYMIRCVKWLREVSMRRVTGSPVSIFFQSCLVMYSVDLFVRGAGYYTSSGFLFMAAAMWMASERQREQDVRHRLSRSRT